MNNKYKLLFVGGTFDINDGRESSLINSIYNELLKISDYEITLFNGGNVKDLHNNIFPLVSEYNIIIWFPNVPNNEDKIRDVKAINPKAMLVTSKRNDNCKYTFAELISRALAIKANLTIEFSKKDDKFNMFLFDPLGNSFYDGTEISELCNKLVNRINQLLKFTRVPSFQDTINTFPDVPEEPEFFKFAHECADIFHNLIKPAKETERFLGNMSFRCQNGFPSFRGKNGIIYVSKRNVDKSDINSKNFVPTYLDENMNTMYFGECKPSVDTPVQLRLYKKIPWANYMIHAHCYVDTTGIQDVLQYNTYRPVPCGAIEEVDEIYQPFEEKLSIWKACYGKEPRLVAINLCGHGCILIAKDAEIFKELQKNKNNGFVQREMPERN